MNHFYQHIDGYFDFENFYTEIINWCEPSAHIIEVGAWKGKSTAYLVVEAVNSKKNIKIDVVDTWLGSNEPEHQNDAIIRAGQLYEHFVNNLKSVEGHYRPVRSTSLEAATSYKDNSLDFVYIDASHEYKDVLADIRAWTPKIKRGGILAGHDFTTAPGVRRAVDEIFGGRVIFKGPSSWMIEF